MLQYALMALSDTGTIAMHQTWRKVWRSTTITVYENQLDAHNELLRRSSHLNRSVAGYWTAPYNSHRFNVPHALSQGRIISY